LVSDQDFSRNLSLELARVTEAAAIMAGRWMGRNEKEQADQAAVDAMRQVLGTLEMEGEVVIGEGEKDNAPMLYSGEIVGRAERPKVDIAVDPVDGTRLLALGMPNSLAVLAIAERGAFYAWEHISYMEKIAVGPDSVGCIDLNDTVANNLARIAKAKDRQVDDLTVVILDRPRHEQLIKDVRAAGSRLKLITDGDVAGALMAAMDGTGIDALMGTGGSPEAVIAAAALKCVGGDMQCRLYPRNDDERETARTNNIDLERIFLIDDLVRGREVFFAATGITDGELLAGVHYGAKGITTQSLVMRAASGTVRYISSTHRPDKLSQLSHVPFD
jgi:fructose-1,6-bisphosphatase II